MKFGDVSSLYHTLLFSLFDSFDFIICIIISTLISYSSSAMLSKEIQGYVDAMSETYSSLYHSDYFGEEKDQEKKININFSKENMQTYL